MIYFYISYLENMKEKIKYIMNQKIFHICMIIVILTVIIFTLGLILLRYNVEGESNVPFELTKVILISSGDGVSKQVDGYQWSYDINHNNDIYIYIEKSKQYTKQEAIKSILIDEIQVKKNVNIGQTKFYRPNVLEEGGYFKNSEENHIENIEYLGAMEANIKDLKISNQGGILSFRYSNEKIAEYLSNEQEINYNELLKKSNVPEENLKATISFNMTILLESGKEYKVNLSFELPTDKIIETGTSSTEITDLKNVAFKRVKN